MAKFTYHDGNTQTPCRTRKQAIAFLIAQNGGEVLRNGAMVARINNNGYLCERVTPDSSVSWHPITPEMRQAAQQEIAGLVPRKYYLIDFVYTDNSQQFGTGADLTQREFDALGTYLETLMDAGDISDWHIHEPGPPVHQTYAQARKEIAKAIRS
jgi:hypothetical protein